MKLSTAFIVYYFFNLWSTNRLAYADKNATSKATRYDLCFLIAFIAYMIIFLIFPLKYALINKLPIASSMVVLCEQLRMLMKSYAFVRSNVSRALKYVPNEHLKSDHYMQSDLDDDESNTLHNLPCPNFSNYLYFLFAPTLIYRDTHEYPRNSSVRWNYVFYYFLQVKCAIFYLYYIFQRFCIPVFRNFDKQQVTLLEYIRSTLNCTLPAVLILLLSNF
jgi:sterol O-acyltransferase